jgi:hypothetical protein
MEELLSKEIYIYKPRTSLKLNCKPMLELIN